MLWRFVLSLTLASPALSAEEPIRVVVSVPPLEYLVERVGGPRVQVQSMVQPGFSPATYEPTPKQVTNLAGADLYVRTGVPFENAWLTRFRSANPDMEILDAREGLEVQLSDRHREHAGHDPHVWTSPRLAGHMARNIRDALISLAPDDATAFEAGFAALNAELGALDAELRKTLSNLPSSRFIVYHPAWGYFAERYGLTQIAIEKDGKEPSARALIALIDEAKRDGIVVVFVQPQFDRRLAEQVARAIGGHVEILDPLSPDYSENLREVARRIAAAGTAPPQR
jgi:zinc transport system substrate-binding protein